ncbi:site-specific DNA-methyltransferase [Myxococcota bacterium]|nr:site-specific DNA-methyltransferase [Myxococcota bacterium]
MRTTHRLLLGDARQLTGVETGSVQLIVTSPPYPMVQMWDEVFRALSPAAGAALDAGQGMACFEAQHQALDAVWAECARALCDGGFLCVNIGDATRSVDGEFCLYPNHARVLTAAMRLGLTPLPDILWRKPNNSPNKFMGSGTLPAGAYVTYEHEYVLILRKGGKRSFSKAEQARRAASAFFWEERNQWFSDLWADLPGADQRLLDPATRARSAAYPLELPYRLILMYSIEGDLVLDPFLGTGTTSAAALAAGRSSVGLDLDANLLALARARLLNARPWAEARAAARINDHRAWLHQRAAAGRPPGHVAEPLGLGVMTRQERQLRVTTPGRVWAEGEQVYAEHSPLPGELKEGSVASGADEAPKG